MSDFPAQYPLSLDTSAPPPRDVDDESVSLVEDRGPDPLEEGFVLVAGVLGVVPGRVRLPHEEDEDGDGGGDGGGGGPDGGPDDGRGPGGGAALEQGARSRT